MTKVKQDHATSIDLTEAAGLIPNYITTQEELNLLEQNNIAEAYLWVSGVSLKKLLTSEFLFRLHKKMFSQVWRWAGQVRTSNKNIGVAKERILQELGVLLGDVTYWRQNETYEKDEIAARFHHRLVQIHIFPNGNGRHARLASDVLLRDMKCETFSWGAGLASSLEPSQIRERYIESLRDADLADYTKLLEFVRA